MEERLERYGFIACSAAALSGFMGIIALIFYSVAIIQP